jgi:spermidine/putrescine transport system permease protein
MKRALGLYAASAFAFLHLPLAVLALFSFNRSRASVWEGFTLDWYKRALADSQLMEAAANSLLIALVATAVATAAGTLCAYALWKKRSRATTLTLSLTLVTPEIVIGISLLALFQWLFQRLDLRLGMHTVILAHVSFCLSYIVIVVLARLRTMDPILEEAALDLGANEWQAFARITLPNLLPGVISAALLAFTISFDDYVITSLVAGVDSETLPMVIYTMARKGVSPSVNAISTIITVAIGIMTLTAERWRRA